MVEVFILHMIYVNSEARNEYCLSLVKPLHVEEILTLLWIHYTDLLNK